MTQPTKSLYALSATDAFANAKANKLRAYPSPDRGGGPLVSFGLAAGQTLVPDEADRHGVYNRIMFRAQRRGRLDGCGSDRDQP